MVAKKKQSKKTGTKKNKRAPNKRVRRKAPAPVMAVPDMGKMMTVAMEDIVATTGISVMGGVAGAVISKIP